MIHPRRSSENTMLPDDIDDDNVIARNVDAMRNLSTSIRCQEDEAISTSKNYFGDVNVRLFVLYFIAIFQQVKYLRLCISS